MTLAGILDTIAVLLDGAKNLSGMPGSVRVGFSVAAAGVRLAKRFAELGRSADAIIEKLDKIEPLELDEVDEEIDDAIDDLPEG